MATLTCKPSVRFVAFTPALMRILTEVYRLADACEDVPEIVITSANDSGHMATSRHYTNEALDLRSKSFPSLAAKTRFASALRVALGSSFTVLFEHAGTDNEHWHIQPKKGTEYAGPAIRQES